MTSDPFPIVIAAAAFLVAGCVKGVVGLGLPLTALAILTNVVGIREAIPLIVVPVMVTNLWQVLQGSALRALLGRFRTLNLALAVGVWAGTVLLFEIDQRLVGAALGALVIAYSLFNLFAIRIRVPARHEPVLSPGVGLCAGLLTGLTGSVGMPIAIYFQAIGLDRETFVQAVSASFLLTSFFWAAALIDQGALDRDAALVGAAALAPSLAGMWAGQRIRHLLSPTLFSRGVFLFLIVVGANLVRKAVI